MIDVSKPGAVEALKDKPFTIKEGATFRMKATFKVQHQILSGLKYIQVVKKMGMSNKNQEMIVSRPRICSRASRLTCLIGLLQPEHSGQAHLREEVRGGDCAIWHDRSWPLQSRITLC